MISNVENIYNKNNRGLTLVEVVFVVLILGIMGVVLTKSILGKADTAKARINMISMEKVKQALGQYKLEYGVYPSRLEELVKRSTDDKSNEDVFFQFAEEADLVDVWKNKFVFKSENDNRTFSLTSYGADGAPGGEGPNQDVTLKP